MEWIPTKWNVKEDLADFDLSPVTIEMAVSPFYEGTRYAVRQFAYCLTTKGKWEYEPIPSSRTDAFYKRCRFKSFDEAKAMAEKVRLGLVQRRFRGAKGE